MGKFDAGQINLLRLVRKGAAENGGWAPVSKMVWPMLEFLPVDLVERELTQDDSGRGRARLTLRGEAVVDYL